MGAILFQATMMDIHLFIYWDTGAQTQSFTFQTSTLSLSYTSTTLHRYLKLDRFQKSSKLMSLPSTLSWLAISVPGKVVWMPGNFFLIQITHPLSSQPLTTKKPELRQQSGGQWHWLCLETVSADLKPLQVEMLLLTAVFRAFPKCGSAVLLGYGLRQWPFLSALSCYPLLWIIGVLFEILRKIYLHVAQTVL